MINNSSLKMANRLKSYKVLHITPHLGGGVGSVILGYLKKIKGNQDFTHKVLCLDYANKKALEASNSIGFSLIDNMCKNHQIVIKEIKNADIVIVHWWNHPLLSAFLVKEILPPARIIFWSHISGLYAPQVFTSPALAYPDLFVFTTPISFTSKEVRIFENKKLNKFRVIWSTGGVDHILPNKMKTRHNFTVGYIGTVDYSKMHPKFLEMSNNINVKDIQFTICGGPFEKDMQEQASLFDHGEKFSFIGPVNDITNYLAKFDLFGYPLAPHHYGTCEQALGESMAAGIPPVVLANMPESSIVENGVSGLIAKNEYEYSRAVEGLYNNNNLMRELSVNARSLALKKYSLDLMIDCWEKLFEEILKLNKSGRNWTGRFYGQTVMPYNIFLESLGDANKNLIGENISKLGIDSQIWRSETKGTPKHYLSFFPDDENLKRLSEFRFENKQ